MKNQSYLSVVVTTANLNDSFINQVSSIHEVVSKQFSLYEVIVVLNGSADAVDLAESQWRRYHQSTIIINLTHKHSHEVAGYVGLEYAKGDYVLEIEHLTGNFSDDLLSAMVSEMEKGFDIVSAIPKQKTLITSQLFYQLLGKTTVVPFQFETEYARLVTRRAVNALFQLKQRVKYRKLLYAYTGFKRSTVSLDSLTHKHHRHLGTFERVGLATDVFISYSTIVLRTTISMALLFMGISIGGGVYSLVIYFVKDVRIEGWTTLMLLLAFGLSGIFFILAMVIKYLEIILRETQSSPLYVVRSASILSHGESRPHV